ncbi:MAG: WhiB family transcriptional regulator [Actinobacteria bacterium]|nr:WhiB family transcriptional regulator [Actinomycetota bacterium]
MSSAESQRQRLLRTKNGRQPALAVARWRYRDNLGAIAGCLTLRYVDDRLLELLARDVEIPVWRPRQPAWRRQAACRGEDPSLFVPKVEDEERTAVPKAICAGCDVRPECLAYALDEPMLLGVWGGLTTRERREMRAEGAA